ncbi:MAG TPA: FAD-dependent oxidoreductase [Bacillota bacterium]|nr:FAD-dependent oxidoreductase [Bacillota bacterium]HPZ91341.1 FAD-dependent oxidoreductase [Bacillota bacterium]HQE02691.1 FAD-dependent oxidoreductase [Bacillota bacterium]
MRKDWDVIVIGAGPAGLAAAAAACDAGAGVCLVERESRPGGILKQCIHDGFGLVRYGEKLTGPEYAWRDIEAVRRRNIPIWTETFLLELQRAGDGFVLTMQNREQAVFQLTARALVAATGCRERTARQIFIHGQRPAGIYTAGTVQHMINIQGYLPGRRCVILGSGDIGLIMARRLVLEGARVEGVYEIKPEPSGLTRNLVQCLQDYNIPLHLSTTVTRVLGRERVEGVVVCPADENLRPLPDRGRIVPCDTLVLSVGLIPENDILEPLGVELNPRTGGPVVDQRLAANVPGLFSCGNALHVNDLVDYVSESGEIAGRAAAAYALGRTQPSNHAELVPEGDILYAVPGRLDLAAGGKAVIYLRANRTIGNARLTISAGDKTVLRKRYPVLRPPEMERIVLDLADLPAGAGAVKLSLRGEENG